MNLPSGISYNPRQPTLIGHGLALLTIDRNTSGNDKYKVEEAFVDRTLESSFQGDWARFDLLFQIKRAQKIDDELFPVPAWSIARHEGIPRLPHMTVVPNLPTLLPNEPPEGASGAVSPYMVLGCDFGRWLPAARDYRICEVREFQSPGMVLIDREDGRIDLCVARAEDKVSLPAGSHVTMYNFGERDQPLVALSFDGRTFSAERDPLTQRVGPLLLAYYDDLEVTFVVNHLHIHAAQGGLRPAGEISAGDRTIRLARTSRQDLGSFLHDQFVENAQFISRFTRLGINVRHAPFDAILEPLTEGKAKQMFFSRPLAGAVVASGARKTGTAATPATNVYRFFLPHDAEPPKPKERVSLRRIREASGPAEKPAPPEPLNRPMVIVVEGAGDWVEKTYRVRFAEIADKNRLSVFYADDSRWNRRRPKWVDAPPEENGLAEWETYLDKAKPKDFLRYSLLRPDAVFVVTPDFLHAASAVSWLDKSPVVFVEKPFDSDLRRVEGLQFTAGSHRTEIIGLDHYQHYVAPLWELRDKIADIVGESLARVEFVLAEDRPIEEGRERSLQYGLTLDLLPHFLALLTFFGNIDTIDEISVPWALRYNDPPRPEQDGTEDEAFAMQNETGAVIDFTFEDTSGNGHRVPCRAVVGKGFGKSVKYLEVTGATGEGLRIDLNEKPINDLSPEYRWNSVFFLSESRPHDSIPDPYRPERMLPVVQDPAPRELDRKRYRRLLADLLNGTDTAMSVNLSISQGGYIVHVLDRAWLAVQSAKSWWTHHPLDELDPVEYLKDFR